MGVLRWVTVGYLYTIEKQGIDPQVKHLGFCPTELSASVGSVRSRIYRRKNWREEWLERCYALKIAGMPLACSATDPMKLFDTAGN